MKIFIYLIPLTIAFLQGLILIKKTCKHPQNSLIPWICALPLGLGLNSLICFLSLLIFNHLSSGIIAFSISILTLLLFNKPSLTFPKLSKKYWFTLLIVLFASLLFFINSTLYPHGGWDAWTVWNLKAKTIFLAGSQWHNIFDLNLWRSNIQYPLLLPLINCWLWVFTGTAHFAGPFITACIFTLSIPLLITSFLFEQFQTRKAIFPALVLLSSFIYIQFGISQYADIVISYFLTSILIFLTTILQKNQTNWIPLIGTNCGLLMFTKNEGFVLGLLLIALLLINLFRSECCKKIFTLFIFTLLTAWASIIFLTTIAPANPNFTNGLLSSTFPTSFERILFIIIYTISELFKPNWNGLWITLSGIILYMLARKKKIQLIHIPNLIVTYLGIVCFYYAINTHFEIAWWMGTTFNRILFTILPSLLFWIFYNLLCEE